jgi:hypothetical protein
MKISKLLTLIAASALLLPATLCGSPNGQGATHGPNQGPNHHLMYRFASDKECCGDTALVRLEIIDRHLDTVQARLDLALKALDEPGIIYPVNPENALYSLAVELAVVGGRVEKALARLHQGIPNAEESMADVETVFASILGDAEAIRVTAEDYAAGNDLSDAVSYSLASIARTSANIEEAVGAFPL